MGAVRRVRTTPIKAGRAKRPAPGWRAESHNELTCQRPPWPNPVVQPAAHLPALAKRNGAYVLEVNPEPTPISGLADETLLGKAGEVLPRIVDAVGRARRSGR